MSYPSAYTSVMLCAALLGVVPRIPFGPQEER
jgi:hypothetical protein